MLLIWVTKAIMTKRKTKKRMKRKRISTKTRKNTQRILGRSRKKKDGTVKKYIYL